ncbi:unnamed protein product [Anisakis simplex]|uniref:CHK domain-containing protein n=1 Tax=Anisakis simplex TaxID=6269 RepID=A0A0M3K7L4_ANISI|nr:unnamed protein product [Anisakis simplex]
MPAMEKIPVTSPERQHIDNTEFTFAWVLKHLNENDHVWKSITAGRRRLQYISFRTIGDGKGFASKIYMLTMEFSDGKAYRVVMKVPTVDILSAKVQVGGEQNADAVVDNVKSAVLMGHARECEMYSKHYRNGMPMPRIFALKDIVPDRERGAILMEYLGDKAANVPFYRSFTVEQLINISRCLARLHAYSMSLSETDMKKLEAREQTADTMVYIFKAFASLEQNPNASRLSNFAKIKHLMQTSDFVRYCLFGVNKELGMKPIIVHGDMWSNNIFINKHEDGTFGNEPLAFIDWQAAHSGSVGEDLARLYASCQADIRREVEQVGLNAYYETFQREMKRRSLDIVHSKEQVVLSYRRLFVYQALLLVAGGNFLFRNENLEDENMKRVWEARTENQHVRSQLAIDDAIRILEEDIPEWLHKNHTFMRTD